MTAKSGKASGDQKRKITGKNFGQRKRERELSV